METNHDPEAYRSHRLEVAEQMVKVALKNLGILREKEDEDVDMHTNRS